MLEQCRKWGARWKASLPGGRRDAVAAAWLVVAAVVWFANAPARPKMLAELTAPSLTGGGITLLGSVNDKIYAVRSDDDALLSVPKSGGKPQVVARALPLLTAARGIGILGADALFEVNPTAQFGAGGGKTPQFTEGSIYRLPLTGGGPIALPFPRLRTTSAVVVGDTCYAIEYRQGRPPRVWCVDVRNPTPRVAAISPWGFYVSTDTVTGRTGFYAQAGAHDHLVYVEKDIPAVWVPVPSGARFLAEAGDDVVWAEASNDGRPEGEVTDLFLTHRDGTARRPLLRLAAPSGRRQFLQALALRRGEWFGVLFEKDASGDTPANQLLAQFFPGRANPVRVLATLPGSRRVDRFEETELDSLAIEEKERWWDWSAAGLTTQRTTSLYRFPLPVR